VAGLQSADILALEVPRTRLSFGDKAFSVAGPRAQNRPMRLEFETSMPKNS